MIRRIVAALVVVLGLTIETGGSVNECVLEVHQRLVHCEEMWGFKPNAVYGEGDVIDVSTVIQYCRTAGRQSLFSCYQQAYSDCELNWSPEKKDGNRQAERWSSRSVEYLCSRVSIIDANKECVQSRSEEMKRCFQTSLRDSERMFLQAIVNSSTEAIPWSVEKDILESYGRGLEPCIINAFDNNCTTIGEFFGNFFYGFSVYVYEKENMGD